MGATLGISCKPFAILGVAFTGQRSVRRPAELGQQNRRLPFGHAQVGGQPVKFIKGAPSHTANVMKRERFLRQFFVIGNDRPPFTAVSALNA